MDNQNPEYPEDLQRHHGAINAIALSELNRINQKVMRLESENAGLKQEMAALKQSLERLWTVYNSHPHHV